MTQRLMLLDTASLYFRAFYGVPDRYKAPDGTPVNAARGLLDMVARLVNEFKPTEIVACWDEDWRPAWRVKLIPSYKAHRVVEEVAGAADIEETPDPLLAQIPIICETLDLLGIPRIGIAEYEADDVIGALATGAGRPVEIVTGDRDLFQLIDDQAQVRVIYTAKGMSNLEVLSEADIVARYGVLPSQYADFATMRGDASDGLPGVRGIGEKSAAALLQEFGDLAGVRAAVRNTESGITASVREKFIAADAYLDVAPTVVGVARALQLPTFDPSLRLFRDDQQVSAQSLAERFNLGTSLQRAMDAVSAAVSAQ